MGMGTSACYADVIDVKHVKKLCPVGYRSFIKVLKQQKVTLDDFAKQYRFEEVENDKILEAWKILCNKFELATNQGTSSLSLGISFHDADNDGDSYDEVNGTFFTVDGMYELTPAGNKFNRFVDRKFYTQFG